MAPKGVTFLAPALVWAPCWEGELTVCRLCLDMRSPAARDGSAGRLELEASDHRVNNICPASLIANL